MSPSGFAFLRERKATQEFGRLDRSFREIVFYAEGSGDWPHIGPVIQALLRDHEEKVSYLTSDPADPGLSLQDDRFRAFMIGSGTARTVLFRKLDCRLFVMTLPDLELLWLKRSVHPVRYIYLFHSINSTHAVYRKGAFDAYDTILCVGPHHVDEIRKAEAVYGLPPKELVEHGSVKLDSVIAEFGDKGSLTTKGDGIEVLVAPSWGDGSLIEQPVGVELLDTLVRAGLRTVVRLHPMTVRRFSRLVPELKTRYRDEALFRVEEDMNATNSWLGSDVMISDWSGAATEYAFALQKPVIYIDTPQKIRNPDWQAIGVPAFEDTIRREIGRIVQPSALVSLPQVIAEVCESAADARERILAARSKWIFNVGRSSEVAAAYLSARSGHVG